MMTNREAIAAQIALLDPDSWHREILEGLLKRDLDEISIKLTDDEIHIIMGLGIPFLPTSLPVIWGHLKKNGVQENWLRLFLHQHVKRLEEIDAERVKVLKRCEKIRSYFDPKRNS